MSIHQTPSGERVHIGFFGRRNAGKSSVVNAVTGQELSVVSDVRGTTTDPVKKAMELLPIGPVMIVDTPGFDDEGHLGEQRVKKTRQILNRTDIAVLVVDAQEGEKECDRELIALFQEKNIPYIKVYNKWDLSAQMPQEEGICYVSARTGQGIEALKERIAREGSSSTERCLVRDLVKTGDLLVLVIPIDSAAPKGRLILPQQQVIRDALEAGAAPLCVRETELAAVLTKLGQSPAMVITDSQVFGPVSAVVPGEVPLTSFSILMARYKGFLQIAVRGIAALAHLQDGDRVLIAEGCTHHRQCEDIGTVKIPKWLGEYTGKQLSFATCSGQDFPEDLSEYALVIHCGGCMLNEREVLSRMKRAQDQNVPVTNYGTLIAAIKGILTRSLTMFPDILQELEGNAEE